MGCAGRGVKGSNEGVGWVERSETHRGHLPAVGPRMGFASLYPSYKVRCTESPGCAGRDAGAGLS
jgi:hypothetical protein